MQENNYWIRRAYGRRGFLAASGIALAGGGALLAGCGSSGGSKGSGTSSAQTSAGASPAAAQPRAGGTLNIYYAGADTPLDPTQVGGFDIYFVFSTMYEYMWTQQSFGKGAGTNVFLQASGVEQPDDVTYVIHLDPNGYFQDLPPVNGRATSADDVKALADYIVADKQVFAREFYANAVDTVTVVDAKTVKVTTKGPQAYFYDGAVGFDRPLVPKELIQHSGDLRKEQPIGSGPWQLGTQVLGSYLEVTKFPKWRVAGQPYVSTVRNTLIKDESAREAAFRGGKLDIMLPSNYQLYKSLVNDMGSAIHGSTQPATPLAFSMNGHRPAFADARVREAIHRALDLQKLLTVVAFGQGQLCGIVGPDNAAYQIPQSELTDYLKYDPQQAKQLLQQAGFDLGKAYNLVISADVAVYGALAPLVNDMLQAVGIKSTIVSVPTAQFQQRVLVAPGDFDFTFDSVNASIGRLLLDHATNSNGAKQNFGNSDSQYDDLVAKSAVTVDANARLQLYYQAQRRLLSIWPISFPMYDPSKFIVATKRVQALNYDFGVGVSNMQPQMWLNA